MKKTLMILAFLCVLIPSASAQWYLFPGSPQQKKEKAQQEAVKSELDRIHGESGAKQNATDESKQSSSADATKQQSEARPASQERSGKPAQYGGQKREPWVFRPKHENVQSEDTQSPDMQVSEHEIADTCIAEEPFADEFVLDIPETINVALLLPIKSVETLNSNFLDYYSGALMAVRDLGKKGMSIDLSVYDTADATARITDNGLANADIIIGPVSPSEIQSVIARCPEDKFIVSPIEPKAAALTGSLKVIQVPSSTDAQLDELIDWIRQDMQPFDKLTVVKDNELAQSNEAGALMSRLEESGLPYTIVESAAFGDADSNVGVQRVIVLSDRDSFLCSTVNAIGKAGASQGNVVLYGTSKLRSLEGINAASLFNAQCHMVSNYFIDYTNDGIRNFVLSYRALFGAEPSSFAFHGYDSISYFVSICAEYGRQWYKKLQEKAWKGLQTDFKFIETDCAGEMNRAVRRMVYKPDLSIALQ